MKTIYLKSGSEIKLSQNDFVFAGGQGEVYVKGSKAYKLYHDFTKCISENHLNELSKLKLSNIIKPEEFIFDNRNRRLGYVMTRIPKPNHALEELCTETFKDSHNLSLKKQLDLLEKFVDGIKHIHSNNILLLDINPLNFLSSSNFDILYFIDVDSYKTKYLSEIFINPKFQDYSCGLNFNTLSDWYSYGVCSFYFLTGIHPFSGKYEDEKALNLPKNQILFERMRRGISVLNNKVHCPAFVKNNIQALPKSYLDWYTCLFEKNERLAPPANFTTPVVPLGVKTLITSALINIEKIAEYKQNILYFSNNYSVTAEGVYGLDRKIQSDGSWYSSIIYQKGIFYYVYLENKQLKIKNLLNQEVVNCSIFAEQFTVSENDVYVKNIQQISKVLIVGRAAGLINVAQCTQNSTKFFDGCVVQNLLGETLVSIFYENKHKQIKLNIEKSSQILDAKYTNQVLIIYLVEKTGKKYKQIYRFLEDFSQYDNQEIEDSQSLNFVVLQNGTTLLNLEDELVLFSNKPNSKLKYIPKNNDPFLTDNFRLFTNGDKVFAFLRNTLYKISMI